MRSLVVLTLWMLAPAAAEAQAFGPGPAGTITGSSMAGMRIGPSAASGRSPGIPNAEIYGDTLAERAFGPAYDNFAVPEIRRGRDEVPIELRATDGRAGVNPVNAGVFARSGPAAIGRSSVTRASSAGAAPIPGRSQ